MGQVFIYVNPIKRQYLNPEDYGMNGKESGLGQGVPAVAVALLICDSVPAGPTGLIGSWAGDPVITAGDYSKMRFPTIVTTANADDSTENLYWTAINEFANISVDSIAMVVNHSDWATEDLAHFALDGLGSGLREIGAAAFRLDCVPLRQALERIDPHWTKRYKKCRDSR